jgi:REP element-mobilizing transposase RayT
MLGYDYSASGKYFITICTKRMTQWFGDIADAMVVLSATGLIVREKWLEIPHHFPFVELDEFVVMPNHIHGIIVINGVETLHATSLQSPDATSLQSPDSTFPQSPDATSLQSFHATSCQQNNQIEIMSSISPKTGSLSVIIRSYKSVVAKNVHHFDSGFAWQPRYHDHIIRTNLEMNLIRKYITDNPLKWNGLLHIENHD